MAIFRFQLSVRKVAPGRPRARGQVNYLLREGEYAPVQQDVRYLTRESPATRDRTDFITGGTEHLPDWAHGDAAVFFSAAERYERVNGRYAMALELSLPRELPREAQLALTHDFITQYLPSKPLLWVMHEPAAVDGGLQPHIHILFSERVRDEHDRGAAQFFRRWNAAHPEQGGARKDTTLHHPAAVLAFREAWADCTNTALEDAGLEVRVDPRSLSSRGLTREAHASQESRAAKDQMAVDAWEARKQQLETGHAIQYAETNVWRQRKRDLRPPPGDRLVDIASYEDYLTRLEDESRRNGERQDPRRELRIAALLREGERMDAPQGTGLTMTLETYER